MSNTNLSFVRFNGAKTMIARAMSDAESALFETGEELGYATVESEISWRDALRACKAPSDRKVLRAGFVSAFMAAARATLKAANNKFDYMARQYAPASTSRKAKATAETRGRKAKAEAVVSKLSEKDVGARLVAALAYIAKAQENHAGDGEMLETLGELAAILGGKTK